MRKYLFSAVLLGMAAASLAQTPGFGVVDKWILGGDGGWDYLNVDGASHRLYVSRSTHVMVVDTDKGEVVGDIPNTSGVHGIALDVADGKGYTSNGKTNSVTVFDLKSLKTLKQIAVGTGPDCIIFDDGTKRIFTFNGRANSATAIDPSSDNVIGTVKLSGRPEYAAADGEGHVFVNIADTNNVEEIDSNTLKSVATWPLAPGEDPSGLAIDRDGHRLFSTCGNGFLVTLDTLSGKVVGTPTIGQGPDAGAYDRILEKAFSSNGGDGTLSIVDRGGTVTMLQTQPGARTMALDADTHRIYLATADLNDPVPGQRRRTAKPGSFTIIVVGFSGSGPTAAR